MLVRTNLIPVGKAIKMFTEKNGAVYVCRRPGIPMDYDTITVHNNGNKTSTPDGERAWLVNPSNQRNASWHYCLRHDIVVQAIPDNEIAYHSNTYEGNHTSLSVEVAESGDFEWTMREAAKWIAEKLVVKGLGVEAVRTHKDWSGKNCPSLLLPRWKEFISMIQKEIDKLNTPALPAWKEKIIRDAHEDGTVNDLNYWLTNADEPMPTWAVLAAIAASKKGE